MLLILRTGTRKKKIQIVKEKKEGDGYDETETAVVLAHLCPHRSRGERFRDSILRRLDSPLFQYAGMIVFVGVIADGAFFFFLLMGWQTLCRPRTDCDPRNGWFNLSIQILNALFTYMALVSVPWRTANFIHSTKWSCPIRSHEPGCISTVYPIRNCGFTFRSVDDWALRLFSCAIVCFSSSITVPACTTTAIHVNVRIQETFGPPPFLRLPFVLPGWVAFGWVTKRVAFARPFRENLDTDPLIR